MTTKFKSIGIIGKYADPSVGPTLKILCQFLHEQGCKVLVAAQTAKVMQDAGFPTATLKELGEQCDLAITVGGDGTLLTAARHLVNHDVPLLGINLGRLGFLVDISPDELKPRIQEVLNGKFEEEHRILLECTIYREDEVVSRSDALNDVVVHKWEMARMIETETYINGRFLNSMRSDGMIVSTPTGSTAYALSAGGPILEPDMNAMVLVPICPHTMSYRPIVIDGDSEIEIQVTGTRSQSQVTCDGQISLGLVSGDSIKVKKKNAVIRLLHPLKHNHYEILRRKLHWGEHF